jgi:cytoskeletal protein CcmA (bactofilin family)
MTEDARAPSGSGGRSHLGAGSRITGELYFPGTVELPGYVTGSVEAAAIVIEEAGEVEGDLRASSIAIKGCFKGRIKGGAVQLHTTARVVADITYESLSIESGAQVEGKCIPRATPKDPAPTDQESGSDVE